MTSCIKNSGATTAAMTKEQTCTGEADTKKLAGAARTAFLKKCIGS